MLEGPFRGSLIWTCSVSPCVYLSVSVSLYLCICVSLSVSVSPCVCLSLHVSFCAVSLLPSFPPSLRVLGAGMEFTLPWTLGVAE